MCLQQKTQHTKHKKNKDTRVHYTVLTQHTHHNNQPQHKGSATTASHETTHVAPDTQQHANTPHNNSHGKSFICTASTPGTKQNTQSRRHASTRIH
ncbi:hypothetical protein SAMN05661109_02840, partial [Corynebacterium cystitidis DSM 20524]